MIDYDATLEADIRKARAKQPPELRDRACRICGPFMLSSCPAAPKHDLRPREERRTMDAYATAAIKHALLTLEKIAKHSSDPTSRADAEGAAGELRAQLPAEYLEP